MMDDRTADVLVFPLQRRIDLVRRISDELFDLNGEDANGYWRSTARRLLEDLVGQGRSLDAARKDVLHLFEAVQVEFRKACAARRSAVTG